MTNLFVLIISLIIPVMLMIAASRLSVSPMVSPLTFIALQVFVGVTMKSFAIVVNDDFSSLLRWSYAPEELLSAIIYLFLFMTLLVSGYAFAHKPRSLQAAHHAASQINIKPVDVRRLLLISVTTTVAVFVLLVAQRQSFSSIFNLFNLNSFGELQRHRVDRIEGIENFGNSYFSTTVFFSVNTLVLIIITTLLFWRRSGARSTNGKLKVVFLICCIIAVMEVLVTGRRNLLAVYMLIYGSIAFSGIHRIGFKSSVKYALAFGCVLVIFSIMTVFRSAGGGGIYVWADELGSAILNPLLYGEYFLSITKITVILAEVSWSTMLWGTSLVEWVVGLVPRPLWPTKPAVSLGPYVKNVIYGETGSISGIPPTFPGELFINFMWAGLLLAPIYGYLIRVVENICFKPSNIVSYGTHWLYFFIITTLTYNLMQNAVGGTVINLIVRCTIAWFVIVMVLKIPRRRFAANVALRAKRRPRGS